MVLSCHNIDKSFGDNDILKDVTFQIDANDKLAIVGNNGAGKSTLLKIIVGELQPDAGSVILGKDASWGYLAQNHDVSDAGTIFDVVMSARRHLMEMERRIRRMEQQMPTMSGKELEAVLEDYEQLTHRFERENGYACRSEVTGVLKGLGFSEDAFVKTMDMLSGGEKTRVSLGRLLVAKPNVLILDEPTNHLDMSSIQWLENYLLNYKGAVVVVAHDRYFMDRIVNKVLDLSGLQARMYRGNYSAFTAQKAQWMETARKAYEKQQKEIAHQEQVIETLRSFNREKSVKRAESRQKTLNKMQRIEAPEAISEGMRFALEPKITSGKDVLLAEHLTKAFDGEEPLFSDLSFSLQRGERIAIIGDNGCGKTTLLKLITGKECPDHGTITIGANVTVGYYDQEQQALDDDKTLFDEMQDAYPGLNDTKIRSVLAAFLFFGDDVYKRIGDLSGGERGRISLAKLMLSGANFLILDEPTNHLDMESKEILENALLQYSGSLLYVSHDRYFINQTAQKILELSEGNLILYYGDYDYYLEKRQESAVGEQREAAPTEASEAKADWASRKKLEAQRRKAKRRLEQTEGRIEELEGRLQKIDGALADEANACNSHKLNELTTDRQALSDELEELYDLWERQSTDKLLNV